MVAKRIIPCLDVKDGRTVKGVNFVGLRDVGDAVELGEMYARQGADELVYLDISATVEGRGTFVNLVRRISERINIPFTVGGGISSLDDAARLLDAGADKISINSAAVRNPSLIDDIAGKYGRRCQEGGERLPYHHPWRQETYRCGVVLLGSGRTVTRGWRDSAYFDGSRRNKVRISV